MIELHSGRFVDPLNLRAEDVDIEDIAWALSNQCRYSGHVEFHYSVAQHSVLVSRLLPRPLKFDGLMHDGSEGYLQDVARPLKQDPYFGKAYRGAEARVQRLLAEVFGLTWPEPSEVKLMDTRILHAERAVLLPNAVVGRWDPKIEATPAVDVRVERWTPERARREFLLRYDRLRRRD